MRPLLWSSRHGWKHYLSATSLAGGKDIVHKWLSVSNCKWRQIEEMCKNDFYSFLPVINLLFSLDVLFKIVWIDRFISDRCKYKDIRQYLIVSILIIFVETIQTYLSFNTAFLKIEYFYPKYLYHFCQIYFEWNENSQRCKGNATAYLM